MLHIHTFFKTSCFQPRRFEATRGCGRMPQVFPWADQHVWLYNILQIPRGCIQICSGCTAMTVQWAEGVWEQDAEEQDANKGGVTWDRRWHNEEFTTCIPTQILVLFVWLNQEKWDRRLMWHVWGTGKGCTQRFGGEAWGKETTLRTWS
jgi:hypothetical protein